MVTYSVMVSGPNAALRHRVATQFGPNEAADRVLGFIKDLDPYRNRRGMVRVYVAWSVGGVRESRTWQIS